MTRQAWHCSIVVTDSHALHHFLMDSLLAAESLILANDLREEGFTVVSAHPGFANTSMGRNVKKATEGSRDPTRSPQETVGDMMRLLQGLSPKDNGKYFLYDGSEMPW